MKLTFHPEDVKWLADQMRLAGCWVPYIFDHDYHKSITLDMDELPDLEKWRKPIDQWIRSNSC